MACTCGGDSERRQGRGSELKTVPAFLSFNKGGNENAKMAVSIFHPADRDLVNVLLACQVFLHAERRELLERVGFLDTRHHPAGDSRHGRQASRDVAPGSAKGIV